MADVTILGAGIFGLSIGWACLRRGARVEIIETARVGAGSSGGIVGALAPHVPESWNEKKAFQLDSLLMAEAWWKDIADISGLDPGYARAGRLQPIADSAALDLARARQEGAAKLWRGEALWQVLPAPQGWAPPSPTGLVIHDTLSAILHPARACASLARALERSGAVIRGGAEPAPSGRIIEATGYAGLRALSQATGRVIGDGVKGQAALLAGVKTGPEQLFIEGLHFVPHRDGTLAIGSTSERDWTGTDDATDAHLDALLARAERALPQLAEGHVVQRWAGIRPRAKSRAPLLGVHPLKPDRFIANGGFKIGFGMAPKVAQVMADLVLEGRDHIPEAFRPD